MVVLITLTSIAFTIVWDHLGYLAGKKLGSTLYDKPDTWYFKKKFFLDAQDSFIKRGDKMLYIGRYLSVGWFLPTLCGVMGMDQSKFTRLSILSAMMRKLSLVIPMSLIMLIFPGIKVWLLILLIFTLPEIVGWIMLFMPKAHEYAEKLKWAKAQIDAIRTDWSHIKSQVGDVVDILKKPVDDDKNIQQSTVSTWIIDSQVTVQSIWPSQPGSM